MKAQDLWGSGAALAVDLGFSYTAGGNCFNSALSTAPSMFMLLAIFVALLALLA
jgi:hypothetical protein